MLVVHTQYQQPGGEDAVVAAEAALLREHGVRLESFILQNRDLEAMPRWRQAQATLWNGRTCEELRAAIRKVSPDVVHIHNTFALASPAVVQAARSGGVPVVMTLHNYRLLCVNALLFREGRICEACVGRLPWRGALYGCYRNSRPASAVVAAMLSFHRALGTWDRVDRFIALTKFARGKFLAAGLPPDKVVVKPNFVHADPGPGDGRGGYALFVGRLSPEKGVGTLLRAWELLGGKVPLRIVGDGPLAAEVQRAAERLSGVEWLGLKEPQEVYDLMKAASFLVFPSEWYEGFPRVLAEAFAAGLPVVSTALGSQGALVDDGRTGLHFRPGDPEDLAAKVEWLLCHPTELARMRREARAEYEAKYTAERNYRMLMGIYAQAIEHRKRK